MSAEIVTELKAFQNAMNTRLDGFEKAGKLFVGRLDALEAELRRPSPNSGFGSDADDTVGARLTKSDAIETFKRGGRAFFPAGQLFNHGPAEFKTTITSAAVGSSTPGILIPQRVAEVVPKPRRRLTLRDLFRARPTTNNAVEFVRENVFTNAASPVAETSAKAESALTFVIASANVATLAHWVPAARQLLDDAPELQRFVNETLLYGLKLEEEFQLLKGDGVGAHLSGLVPNATGYVGTYFVTSDNKLDTLRHAILEMEAANEFPDFMVLNPRDVHDIDLLKTEEGGVANKGSYLAADPISGTLVIRTFWGLPIVSTNAITAGKFLIGASSKAELYDRMQAVIDISTEHSDFFIKNLVAIRAEERLALAIYRTTAFVYGSF